MLAVYAIVNGQDSGWTSLQTLGLLAISVALLGVFVFIESRAKAPLVPLELFKHRTLATANGVAALLAAAMFSWFFLSALYLQQVLGYDPLQVGLAFLPATVLMGLFSLGLSARVVMRFGIRGPLVTGLGLMAAGLLWFARAPVDGMFAVDVLPGMILLALGAGMAFNPLLLAAMGDVPPEESGLASGLVNTTQMMGGAVGLAILVSIAAARTADPNDLGDLTAGYHAAFLVGAAFAIVALVLAAALMQAKVPAMGGAHGMEPAPDAAHDGKPVGEAGIGASYPRACPRPCCCDCSRRYPDPTALARNAAGASLFPVLARLEHAGLVRRRGGLYRLTARGRSELALDLQLGRAVARGLSS